MKIESRKLYVPDEWKPIEKLSGLLIKKGHKEKSNNFFLCFTWAYKILYL